METKIKIKSSSGSVLFEYAKENNTLRDTLEEAVRRGVYLRRADLQGADLRYANLQGVDLRYACLQGANLRGADLHNADLRDANLYNAYLYNADLRDADLRDADLRHAYLYGAYLYGADLCDANLYNAYLYGVDLCGIDWGDWGKIQTKSDILSIGAIGSRNGYTMIFHTDKGLFVQCGCFGGTIEEFEAKVKETHKGNKHERDYMAMIEFVKKRFAE